LDGHDHYHVVYDEQCEICQAGVSWLEILDRRERVVCHPIEPDILAQVHPTLTVEACLRELHVVTPDRSVVVGWDAVAALARLFPETWLIGAAGVVPGVRSALRALYRFVARNRYELSKCRGGACRVERPIRTRRRSRFGVFWSCYTAGMVLRLPLSIAVTVRDAAVRIRRYVVTFRKRFDLLDGRLQLLFIGGFPCDVVPIVFGEQFWTVIYKGVVVDPGSPKMRGSLLRHIRRLPADAIHTIVATHHHEEHSGNLNWLAEKTGAKLYVSPTTAELLAGGLKLPWARRFIIGAPDELRSPFELLKERLPDGGSNLLILPAPGHCADHIILYDPEEKLLIVADAFMGVYFSAPNPDVDSRSWIDSLERMLALDVEILIEGHGLIHTERKDIPDIPGVVVRENPRKELEEKLRYLRWLRRQVDAGFAEGLSMCAIEATCFPWGRVNAWETFLNDHLMRLFSLGHWSRAELVRSFVRSDDHRASLAAALPMVYQARIHVSGRSGGLLDDSAAPRSQEVI